MSRILVDFTSVDHPIGALIAPSGLHLLRTVDRRRTPHKELLSALAERWWPTTDTFHFGWGEMTMTPEDFSAIFGIPFGVRPLEFYSDWRQAIPPAQMTDLPQDYRCVARTVLATSGSHIFDGFHAGTVSVHQATRFTVLLLIASTFYVNKKQAVDLGILKSLEDLSCLEYDWAGAMLCRLYEDMCTLWRGHTKVCSISYCWEVMIFNSFSFS